MLYSSDTNLIDIKLRYSVTVIQEELVNMQHFLLIDLSQKRNNHTLMNLFFF